MGQQKNHGFTIIEVSLVLAISSLLLVLMMTSITLAVQRQRFSDSINGTQSFLQQQFNLIQNTLNDRTTGTCGNSALPGDTSTPDPSVHGASGCIILGKVFDIQETTSSNESAILSYDVIATNVNTEMPPYATYSDIDLIRNIKPTAIKQSASDENYIVPWGAEIRNVRDATNISNGSVIHIVALLRSPRSGVIHVYEIDPGIVASPLSSTMPTLLPPASIQEITNGSIKMCMNSADLIGSKALLEITPIGSQDGILTHFDDGAKGLYGCP